MCVFVIWDLDLGSLSDHAVTNSGNILGSKLVPFQGQNEVSHCIGGSRGGMPGAYGYNGFGHNIVVDVFFEQEGTEPLRKKARVVKSAPLATGKKPPTATKVARKTQPSAAASKASTSYPDYQPPEGAAEGDSDEDL